MGHFNHVARPRLIMSLHAQAEMETGADYLNIRESSHDFAVHHAHVKDVKTQAVGLMFGSEPVRRCKSVVKDTSAQVLVTVRL